MGSCASFYLDAKIKVKAKEDKNGVEIDNVGNDVIDFRDFRSNLLYEKFKELKKDLFIESGDESYILRWKPEYMNMNYNEINNDTDDGLDYFYAANVYKVNKIKVSKDQLKKLGLDEDALLKFGYFELNLGATC